MNANGTFLSIVIPVKDEAENIRELAREIIVVADARRWDWECVWVDDGSTDGTLTILRDLNRVDPRHRYLSFVRNTGQSAALWAGFRAARGRVLATLDGDGQNDPRDLPRLMEVLQSGRWDMVNGYRSKRRDPLSRKVASKIANTFRNCLTGRTVRDVGCSIRVFKAECVADLPRFKGMHRFLPCLAVMQGCRITEIAVDHRPRRYGKTKYSINNRLWVGLIDTLGVLWLRLRGFRIEAGPCSEDPV